MCTYESTWMIRNTCKQPLESFKSEPWGACQNQQITCITNDWFKRSNIQKPRGHSLIQYRPGSFHIWEYFETEFYAKISLRWHDRLASAKRKFKNAIELNLTQRWVLQRKYTDQDQKGTFLRYQSMILYKEGVYISGRTVS